MENKPDKKIIAIFLATFVFLATVILSLGGYYGQKFGQVAGESETAEVEKLKADYILAFKQAFQGYLVLETETDWLSDNLLEATRSIKQTLLGLRVPLEFKDRHLTAIIALTAIEQGIGDKNLDLVLPHIYELRQLIDNL